MMNCNIHDLKFNGRFFTWTNKQSAHRRVLSKIDGVMGNLLWEDSYLIVEVLTRGDL